MATNTDADTITLTGQGPMTYADWMALERLQDAQDALNVPDPSQDMANEGGMLYNG